MNTSYICPLCESDVSLPVIGETAFDYAATMSEFEKRFILACIETCKGNVKRSARMMKLEYYKLRHLVEKYNLDAAIEEIKKNATPDKGFW